MSFYRTCLKKDILILENGKEKNNISQKFVAASLPVRTVSAAVYAILLVGCLVCRRMVVPFVYGCGIVLVPVGIY